MADFVEVGFVADIHEGAMKEVTVQGKPVLLAKVSGNFYAVQGRCTHMGGVLANGTLNGTVVQCPLHSSQFDLKDGSVVRWMKGSGLAYNLGKALKGPKPLAVYAVKVEQNKILVQVT